MKISYQFEGHNLVDWAEHGGLPVKRLTSKKKFRLISSFKFDDIDEWMGLIWHENSNPDTVPLDYLSLYYTPLEEVIKDAPDWATHFSVHEGIGVWHIDQYAFDHGSERIQAYHVVKRYMEQREGVAIRESKGHLFDQTNYHNPVKLEELR